MIEMKERFKEFYRKSREGLDRTEKAIRELPSKIEELKKEKNRLQKKGTRTALNTASDIGELIKFLGSALRSARRARSAFEIDCKVYEHAISNLSRRQKNRRSTKNK